jgi:PadR family transcriptional regulator, regulatory protein PadR
MADQAAIRQGTLDMLILKALSLQPMHGWGIAERIQQLARDVLAVPQGSLYPALHRLEARGLIVAEWRQSDDNRRAKYYQLQASGSQTLTAELAEWSRFMRAVQLVLDAT